MARESSTAQAALIVEDDPGVRFVVERAVQAVGLVTVSAGTLAQARQALASQKFACAFLDIRLPDGSAAVGFQHRRRHGH